MTGPFVDDLIFTHVFAAIHPDLILEGELHILHKLARLGTVLTHVPEVGNEHVRDPDTVVPRERHVRE